MKNMCLTLGIVFVTFFSYDAQALSSANEQYLAKGVQAAGEEVVGVITEVLRILWLPVGIIECTLGAPIGFFDRGLKNIAVGLTAPFKAVGHALSIPFKLIGVF